MRKKVFGLIAMCLCALGQAFASSFIGISADGNSQTFQVDEVRSIKIAPKKNGFKSYETIKFGGSVTGINESGASYFIQTFPNPVDNFMTVTGVDDNAQISVLNMQGIEVLRTKGTRVEVSSLSQGSYILIVNGHKVKFIKK